MKYILSCFVLAVCMLGCSQDSNVSGPYTPTGITVRSQQVLGPGVRQVYGEISYAQAVNVDSAGADRVWRFGDYQWSDSFSLTFCTPQDCPHADRFPSSTRGVDISYSDYGDGYTFSLFERVDPRGIWDLGMADEDDYNVFESPSCRLELPCSYGTRWTEVQRDSVGSPGYMTYWIDSTIYTCDAWGKLVTPYDSCRVLRGAELFAEYTTSWYDTTWHLSWADLNYYWFDEHGDIVAWASSGEDYLNPYFDLGYVNVRLSKEQVPAVANSGRSNLPPVPRPEIADHSPRESRSFLANRFRN